jgi:hypothetical protein
MLSRLNTTGTRRGLLARMTPQLAQFNLQD